eukprot:gene4762-5389_t
MLSDLFPELNIEFSADEGSFASLNYPMLYPNNLTCHWTIRTPDHRAIIQLNFTDFHVEPNKKCLYDYVMLGDGIGGWSVKFCGDKSEFTFLSRRNLLIVAFLSDTTHAYRGFRAVWRAVRLKNEDKITTITSLIQPSPTLAKCPASSTITTTYCPTTSQQPLAISRPCSCTKSVPIASRSEHKQSPNASKSESGRDVSFAAARQTSVASVASERDNVFTLVKGLERGSEQHSISSVEISNCVSDIPSHARGVPPKRGENAVVILGILIAVFAILNITLLMLWLHCRRRPAKNASQQKTELFDRITFLPNVNGNKRDGFALQDRKLAMLMESYLDDEQRLEIDSSEDEKL